jgi:hypothetical protein
MLFAATATATATATVVARAVHPFRNGAYLFGINA